MFAKSFMTIAATAAIGAAVALAPAIASARGGGGHGGGGHGGGGGHRGVGPRGGGGGGAPGGGVWGGGVWVGGVARGGGGGGRGRSPSMAASFMAHASTAVFSALPSAAPSTPTATIPATMAAGSGIPAATATCAFGSVDRRCCADERRRSLRGVRRCHVCFVADAEDGLLRGKSREREVPDRLEIRPAVTREFVGGEDHSAQFAGELLEPRGQIYCGANAGEIQPVSAADVAVQDVADVKRQSETHAAYFFSGRAIQRSDVSARLVCAGQRACANLRGVAVVADREDGQ